MKLNKFYNTLKSYIKNNSSHLGYSITLQNLYEGIADVNSDNLTLYASIDDIPSGINTTVNIVSTESYTKFYDAGTKDFPSFISCYGTENTEDIKQPVNTADLQGVTLDSKRLLAFIKAAIDYDKKGKSYNRSIVHQVCLETIKDNTALRMAYTNGKLLVTSEFTVSEGFTLPFKQTVIPCSVLPILQAIIGKAKRDVSLYTAEDKVIFAYKGQTLAYKCKEEHYPDVDRFITSDLVIVDDGFMSCHADTILICEKEANWGPAEKKGFNPPMVRLSQDNETYYVEKSNGTCRKELGSWDSRFEFSCLFNVELLKPILTYIKDTGESYKLGFKAGSNYSNSGLIFSNQNSFIILMPMRS